MCDREKLPGKKAGELLGVHSRTLYNWEKSGKIKAIRTPGGKRLYNIKEFIENNSEYREKLTEKLDKLKICYCRVSSNGQADDLERQIKYMTKKYPNHLIIKDIGSGLNFKRRGLNKIIKYAIAGKIEEVVIAYKDRLTRFGYELIEQLIIDYSGGKITIINKPDSNPETEIAEDMIQIMNVFVARMNGSRKYKNIQKR